MSKRLAYLESIVANGSADSFGFYCLALEYKNLGRPGDAADTFSKLREKDRDYVPMYLMCGSMLIDVGEPAKARAWLTEGETVASARGDLKALGEIRDALAKIEGA